MRAKAAEAITDDQREIQRLKHNMAVYERANAAMAQTMFDAAIELPPEAQHLPLITPPEPRRSTSRALKRKAGDVDPDILEQEVALPPRPLHPINEKEKLAKLKKMDKERKAAATEERKKAAKARKDAEEDAKKDAEGRVGKPATTGNK